jgi:hypothetical protein
MRAKFFWAFLAFSVMAFPAGTFADGDSAEILFHLNSQSSISFTSSQTSFQLTLPGYQNGMISDSSDVQYQIMANAVGRLEDLVLIRLMSPMDGIAIEGRMGQFSKEAGTAHLVSNSSDYVALSTTDTGLADKVIDEGEGRIIDGSLTLSYRARALRDLEAGNHEATLIVSFADN